MNRYFLLFIVLILTFNLGTSTAQAQQTASYYGNLIRIPFTAKSVSLSDTLGSWYDYYTVQEGSIQYNEGEAYYFDHLTLPMHSYLLKTSSGSMGPYIQQFWGAKYIENEGQNKWRAFNHSGAGWDVIPPYFFELTKVVPADSGCWLLNGSLGNSFIYNNDSLRIIYNGVGQQYSQTFSKNLVFILGEVSDRYLAAFAKEGDSDSYEYRLFHLSESPGIKKENTTLVKFIGTPDTNNKNINYEKVRKIYNDLYLAQADHVGGLQFLRFSDTSLTYVKTVFKTSDFPTQFYSNHPWDFRNNKFYNIEPTGLCAYEFNISDSTFVNRRLILKADFPSGESLSVDRNFRYAARRSSDTLWIYDIEKESFINSISLAGINRPMGGIIDSPYVYLHQTTRTVTDVEKENTQVVKSYVLTAYPNPFNPSTTLEFNIPVAGQVELKIYDVLGKEVTTLLNEERKAGTNKVQFNASSLPSGVYLCRMSAGKYTTAKKIVLLK